MSLRTLGAIVGTIGAGMSGYARGKRDYESDQAFKEDRDFQRGQRARMVKKQGEEDALGDALKGAAGSTDAQIRAYEAAGRPVEAMDLRTKSRADKLGQLQLDEAQRTHLNRTYDDELDKKATSFDALAQFISDSNGDGQGGAMKVRAVPTADGKKITLNRIGPDGTLTPTEYTFDNTQGGLASAKALLSRSVTPQMKLAHLYQQAQAAEQARHNQATESTAARNAATAEAAQRATAAYHARMAGVAEGKVGATAQQPGQLTLADLKDGHKAIASTLNADYKSQIDGAASPQDADPIKRTREAEIADVQRLYTGAMMAGMPLTPEQAIAAFRAGRRGMRKVPDSEGNVHAIEGMQVGDRFIPFAGQPGVTISNGPGGEANGQWDVPGRSTAPAPAPAAPAPRAAMAPPPYQPPAGSQAATMLQARAQAAASREEAKRATAAASEALAAAALQSADKRAALEAMRSDGYSMLPEATRVALYKLANSR